ncbi:hypothetical protein ACTWJ8_40350 (plasmid) [Streptomyces sp. SDT5-1]|uniref:hypothetical protein n=1 Tax=Streptomyces sp. SDT5-1 TaxID=3406418 RepID=UPI003FD33450
MSSQSSDFEGRLAAATARIQYGNDERNAGADDRARAIADEAARRGRGGPRQLANELGVSPKTISQAIARARRAPSPVHTLPGDTLERLFAAELKDLPPLPAPHWGALVWIVRSIYIDVTWIEQPGPMLAMEVEDAELDDEYAPDDLAKVCRGWSRVRALAVIDACQRQDLDALPTTD